MKKLINLAHHLDDYECMWNGIEDIYIDKTKESLPPSFFFVLSGGGSFCYLNTPKGERKKMIALGDGRTKKMYEFLAPIVGFEYKHYEYSSFESAIKKAKKEINSGYPVVLGALDMFYLPYFKGIYMKKHIPFHYILMVGYDDENKCIYVHDCGREEIVTISYELLEKAMNCSYEGLSKPNTVCIVRMNETKDKIQIAKEALSKKKELFLNPPAKILGYKGFEKFLGELPKLRDEIGKIEYDKILANMVEFFGTVPTVPNALKGIDKPDTVEYKGGFDKMSRVLRYLNSETGEKHFESSAECFDRGAIAIQRISNIIINYLSGKKDETVKLTEYFNEVYACIKSGYMALDIR